MTSPGFGGFDTTVETMNTTASDTRKTASDVAAGLSTLRAYVMSLSEWVGDASGAFQNLMQDFDTNAHNLNDALTNIAVGLDQNAANYAEGEGTNTKQVANLQGAMPKINV